jgi:hypothetical protein
MTVRTGITVFIFVFVVCWFIKKKCFRQIKMNRKQPLFLITLPRHVLEVNGMLTVALRLPICCFNVSRMLSVLFLFFDFNFIFIIILILKQKRWKIQWQSFTEGLLTWWPQPAIAPTTAVLTSAIWIPVSRSTHWPSLKNLVQPGKHSHKHFHF